MAGGRADARRLWLAGVGLLLVGVGLAFSWPRAAPALDCPPPQIRRDGEGVAFCVTAPEKTDGGGRLAAGQVLTLGLKIDLNAASEEDLRLLPGIGAKLSGALISERERLGRFESWAQVDEVAGVGPAKLETLKSHSEIR